MKNSTAIILIALLLIGAVVAVISLTKTPKALSDAYTASKAMEPVQVEETPKVSAQDVADIIYPQLKEEVEKAVATATSEIVVETPVVETPVVEEAKAEPEAYVVEVAAAEPEPVAPVVVIVNTTVEGKDKEETPVAQAEPVQEEEKAIDVHPNFDIGVGNPNISDREYEKKRTQMRNAALDALTFLS